VIPETAKNLFRASQKKKIKKRMTLSPLKTISIKVFREIDEFVLKIERNISDYCQLLENLSSLLGSLSLKRERLELIRNAPDKTFGVLFDFDNDIRIQLSLGYSRLTRKTFDAICVLRSETTTILSNVDINRESAWKLLKKHRLQDDVETLCARNDAVASLVDRIEFCDDARQTLSTINSKIQSKLELISLDESVEKLNNIISFLDDCQFELKTRINSLRKFVCVCLCERDGLLNCYFILCFKNFFFFSFNSCLFIIKK
jgi:hypothetical protein